MLEIQEMNIRQEQLEKLKKELPNECRNCTQLEVIDVRNGIVRCFYKVKDRCILKHEL